jgi:hypothetical protein
VDRRDHVPLHCLHRAFNLRGYLGVDVGDFSQRLRLRGVAISTFANWSANVLSALIFPLYTARFGMHTFFFTTAAVCLVAPFFFCKFVPETKGRSLEEIEPLWSPHPRR